MSTTNTPNLNLHTWELNDFVSMDEMNRNFNIIDQEVSTVCQEAVKKGEFGVGGFAVNVSGTNVDEIIESGIYGGNSLQGTPSSAGYIIHLSYIEPYGGNYAQQIFYPSVSAHHKIYIRRKIAGVWQAWVEDLKTGDYGIGSGVVDISSTDISALRGRGSGFYGGTELFGAPSTDYYFVQHIDSPDGTIAHQTLTRSAYGHPATAYTRSFDGYDWSEWKFLLTEAAINIQPDGRSRDINDGTLLDREFIDLNQINKTGIYSGHSLINSPSTIPSTTGYVTHVEYRAEGYAVQTYHNVTGVQTNMSIRKRVQGEWGKWISVQTEESAQSGFAVINPTASKVVTQRVTFKHPFKSGPSITVSAHTQAPQNVSVSVTNITATYFDIALYRTDTIQTYVYWQAAERTQ